MNANSKSGLVLSLVLAHGLSGPGPAAAKARAAELDFFKGRIEGRAPAKCDDSPGSPGGMEFRRPRCKGGNAGSPLMMPIVKESKETKTPFKAPSRADDHKVAVLPSPRKPNGAWVRDEKWNSLGPSPPPWLPGFLFKADIKTGLSESHHEFKNMENICHKNSMR